MTCMSYNDKSEEELLAEGFTAKMARFYTDLMSKERESGIWSPDFLDWSHSNGFLAESASAYSLSEENISEYLSDYDYYKIWPLNSWERVWINDKLTLRYLLAGTDMDCYMPHYYFYCDSERGLIPLIDNGVDGETPSAFLDVLRKQGDLACKPCNGSGSEGFFRLSYGDGEYSINGRPAGEEEIADFAARHVNYIFTEYLLPDESLAKISPLIHTLRLVVANDPSQGPQLVGGYLRFANTTTGAANHTGNLTFRTEFDYDTEIDLETGRFRAGKAIYSDLVEDMPLHPDNGRLAEGKVRDWDKVLDFALGFARKYGPLDYLGFDLCMTRGGVKLMEINSHPGIKHMQIRRPLLRDGFTKDYFERKMEQIGELDEAAVERRRRLWR